MNPEIKERWVKALKSGDYKQGAEVLARRDPVEGETFYCCLGVLCDIAAGEDVAVVEPEGRSPWGGEVVSYDLCDRFLPENMSYRPNIVFLA